MAGQQKKKSGLGRGIGALIPTSTDTRPRLGDNAADVILGPRREESAPRPPRPSVESGAKAPRPGAGSTSTDPSAEGYKKPARPAKDNVSRETEKRTASATVTTADGTEIVDPGAVYREISPKAIEPNPKQPRTVFDEDALAELVHSVREFGLLQPIVVREIGPEKYQLIMGERRWRASQEAGLDVVPAVVRQTEDENLLRDALLENIHRVELNPLEEAAAYEQLLEEFGVTQAQLAERLGRSRPAITNAIRLLQLPTAVQRRVAAKVLSAGHARALLSLEAGPAAQDELAARIVAEGLSVRSTEEIVALANSGQGGGSDKPKRRTPAEPDPALDRIASTLSDRFDTKVSVKMGKKKGRITIDVGSSEDLERIIDILRGKSE